MNQKTGKNDGNEFSQEREFKVILEDIYTQFRVFGEGMQDVQKKLGKIDGRLDRIEIRLDHVEIRLTAVETRLTGVETRLDRVEIRLTGVENRLTGVETRLGCVEKDVAFIIKMALPTVATKDDIKAHDRRITLLERAR